MGATSRVATRRIRELRRKCLQQCLDCQPEHIRAVGRAPASVGEESSPWALGPGCCRPCGRISGCHGALPIECRIHLQKVAPRAMKSKIDPKNRRRPFLMLLTRVGGLAFAAVELWREGSGGGRVRSTLGPSERSAARNYVPGPTMAKGFLASLLFTLGHLIGGFTLQTAQYVALTQLLLFTRLSV